MTTREQLEAKYGKPASAPVASTSAQTPTATPGSTRAALEAKYKTKPSTNTMPRFDGSNIFEKGANLGIGAVEGLSNIGVGIGTTVGKTGLGIGELALKGVGKLGLDTSKQVEAIEQVKKAVYEDPFKKELSSKAGKTGQALGAGAMFLTPSGAVTKAQGAITGGVNMLPGATKTAQFAKGALGVLGRAAPEAISAGGVSLAMSGGDTEQAKKDAILGGAFSAGFGAIGSAYRGAKNVILPPEDVRLLVKAIRPTGQLAGKGYKGFTENLPRAVEEVKKTGMPITNLETLGEATNVARKKAWEEVVAANNTGVATNVNLESVAEKIVNKVIANNKKLLLESPESADDIVAFANKYRNAKLSVPEAQDILTQTNALLKDSYGRGISPANVTKFNLEKQLNLELADALRGEIDTTLEALGTTGAKELRKKYGALAQLSEAVQSRIPKEDRLAALSLGQQFNFPVGAGKIFAGIKTGQPGLALEGATQIGASQIMKNLNKSDELIGRVFGGAPGKAGLTERAFGGYSKTQGKDALDEVILGATTAAKKTKKALGGDIPNKQGGYIKNPLMQKYSEAGGAVSKASDDITSSIKQAKASGQSFDDWVKGKATELNYKNLQENEYSIKAYGKDFNEPVEYFRAGEIKKNGDIWLTDNEGGAMQYSSAGGGTKVGKYIVQSKNPLIIDTAGGKYAKGNIDISKILTKEELAEGYTNNPNIKKKFIDYAKNNGYDAVQFADSFPDGEGGMRSLVVWNKDAIKTKSQLKTEWDKVGGTKVYHGSPYAKTFTKIDPKKLQYGELGRGLYYSPDKKVASEYMEPRGEVYSYAEAMKKAGIKQFSNEKFKIKRMTRGEYTKDFRTVSGRDELIKKYTDEGYDGVELTDEKQGVIFPHALEKIEDLTD